MTLALQALRDIVAQRVLRGVPSPPDFCAAFQYLIHLFRYDCSSSEDAVALALAAGVVRVLDIFVCIFTNFV